MSERIRRPDCADFSQLFLNDTPLLDLRAPIEFAKGAFPHTQNLPLMLDDERAKVGTCYKKHGQQAAITLGHQLVSGATKAERLAGWIAFTKQHPNGYLYCFRGGLRSQTVQQWLAEAGVHYPRIIGGYKALRRYLLESLERLCAERRFVVLAGRTGCAKTELLQTLGPHIDLEGIANHRGSAFGKRVGGQPAQIAFENALAIALLRHEQRYPDRPVLVEDESLLIGRCALPDCLREVMNQAPVYLLERSLAFRVEHSFNNYILDNLQDWQKAQGADAGFEGFADELRDSLRNIRKRLGGERYQMMSATLEQALLQHRAGDATAHRDWIEPLLADYYDPMYHYQLERKAERIVFTGGEAELVAALQQRYAG